MIKKARQFAEKNLDELRYLHTKDVVEIALEIAEKENADREIVEISAWLHDIGFTNKKAKIITHHIYSAKIAENLLKEFKVESTKIEQIIQCIKEHMGPVGSGFLGDLLKTEGKDWNFLPRPSTKESKAVYDADMINLCSPFGVAKIIFLNAKQGKNFKDAVNITRITAQQAFDDLQTKSGKEVGKKYFSASEEFFKMIRL